MELKIKPNKILMWLSYNCLFFSIMLKMLYQTNQNSTIRLLEFGMQAIVLLCYFLEELITLKRKSINCITLILGILVVCGTISCEDGSMEFYKGDCIFVPADSEVLTISGQAQFLDVRG